MVRIGLVVVALTAGMACGGSAPEAPAPLPVPKVVEATPAKPVQDEARPRVVALSVPVDHLVRLIAAGQVDRELLVPIGEDPPFWQPAPEAIAGLADADLLVANGAGYEAWLATATVPEHRLVKSAQGLDLIVREGKAHSHGADGEHTHAGIDPHTWMDPRAYLHQARAVHAALVKLLPDDKPFLDGNFQRLERDLLGLDLATEEALAPLKGLGLASSHPAFAYLARRYGLTMVAFDLDPAERPSDAAIKQVSTWAATQDPAILWWEAPPSPAALKPLPETITHVTVDPLEQPGDDGMYDYMVQARGNLPRLKAMAPAPPMEEPAPE